VSSRVVAREDELQRVAREAADAPRVAVDLEASGMFAYRARACTVQLAWGGGERVAVVDVLAVGLDPLASLLDERGPVKIVHDVAFDARMFAEAGMRVARVHDTAVAARMLGRAATGLAALLETELGVHIAKDMQQRDWRQRPIDAAMLGYLCADVAHLERLDERLWAEVVERGIEQEVLQETDYRLACAQEATATPSTMPPYARIKGVQRLAERDLAALRTAADLREHEAERRDVPPYRVATNDALVAAACARPASFAELVRVRGFPTSTRDARAFGAELVRALASTGDKLPDEERARFERPRTPHSVAKEKRQRESRVLAWRREEAKARGVDEQVVLPGHCLKDAVEARATTPEELARVAGIGAFRVARYGEAILQALKGPAEAPA
jgi:ribonuclease D